MLKYVVPKLAASLREGLVIDPSNQDMDPLYRTAPWVGVLQPKVYSQLLEVEFFPKWLTTLHLWLTQPTSDYDEVAQWFVTRLVVDRSSESLISLFSQVLILEKFLLRGGVGVAGRKCRVYSRFTANE